MGCLHPLPSILVGHNQFRKCQISLSHHSSISHSPKQQISSLSLSLSLQHTTPAPPSFLSQLQTLIVTAQHCRSSPILTRLTFVSLENAQNCLSIVSNHNVERFFFFFLLLSTPDFATRFSPTFFSFYFLKFLFTCVFFFPPKKIDIYILMQSYVEMKLVLFDKILQ